MKVRALTMVSAEVLRKGQGSINVTLHPITSIKADLEICLGPGRGGWLSNLCLVTELYKGQP
jgi:hypothetical protein